LPSEEEIYDNLEEKSEERQSDETKSDKL